MTKKRLLFFTNSLYGGGAEKVLQTLLSNLDSSKYDITLYSVNEETLNERYPSNLKFRYIFKQNATNAISRFWVKIINKIKLIVYYNLSQKWFYRLFVKGKYDTEIAFIEGYSTRIISGSTNKSSNKVAWVHIDLLNNHWTNIAYQNKIEEEISYYKYNNIICVSENVEESMLKLFPKLKKVQVKYNPIDDKSIRKFSTENCTYYNDLNLDTIKLVSTGRLVHQKGYDRLLPIIKRLVDDGHNIHLTILGEGSDRRELEEYITNNNLNNVVSLPGFVQNPYAIMAQHDIFVCSSRAEGYSTAITEALILGLPIVTTDCSGMKELLGENNEYGIVTQNDDDALYKGIKSIINSNEVFKLYKSKAIARGKDFSLSKQISEIENIL